MIFTASEIANIVGGKVEGDPSVKVSKLSKIEEGRKGSLTFLSNPKYTPYIYSTGASIIIVDKGFVPDRDFSTTLIRVDDAYNSFSVLLDHYEKTIVKPIGIHKFSDIDPAVNINKSCHVGPFSVIKRGVRIGENVQIYSNVFIGENVQIGSNSIINEGVKIISNSVIGNNCIIHNGSIIGSDGFGFVKQNDNTYKKIPQTGNVIIDDFVEIGANTTIDKATLGSTIIKKGVKIDNLVQIAHSVLIGDNTIIAAQVGIAGSTIIGKNCIIGGQAGVAGHISIGNNVTIAGKSGVTKNIDDNKIIAGFPAIDINEWKRNIINEKNKKI